MVTIVKLNEEKYFNDKVFPLTVSPSEDNNSISLKEYWLNNSNQIDSWLKSHSAILFRGFNINTPEKLQEISEAANYSPVSYTKGIVVRNQLTKNVFTANEAPPTKAIAFHHEMVYRPEEERPTHLFFCCQQPATSNGQTPILLSSILCDIIKNKYKDFYDKLSAEGICILQVKPADDDGTVIAGRGWKSLYQTESKEEVEKKIAKNGGTFKWRNGDVIEIRNPPEQAIAKDSRPDRAPLDVFTNNIIAGRTMLKDMGVTEPRLFFGDGTPIDAAIMDEIAEIARDISVSFLWKEGDVLLLDNFKTMHSREPFEGMRKVLVSMGRDVHR